MRCSLRRAERRAQTPRVSLLLAWRMAPIPARVQRKPLLGLTGDIGY